MNVKELSQIKSGITNVRIYLLLFIIIFLPFYGKAQDRIKITTSNHQLAGVAQMVTGELAEIEIIASYKICPEHYSLKPSDLGKLKDRDLLIYIDEKFELFINNIKNMHKGKILKVSSVENLYVDNGNYHIWMDLNNVKLILNAIYKILIDARPDLSDILQANLQKALKDIDALILYKAQKFANMRKVLLLHNAPFYLFDKNIAEKQYINNHNITIRNIDNFLDLPKDKCLISNKNENFYVLEEKIGRKIVKIDCEKWQFDVTFIEQYKNIVDIAGRNCS